MDIFESVAVENPDENTVRSWFGLAIRADGAVIALAALRDRRLDAGLLNLTGLFGLILLFVPKLYERVAGLLVYERPASIQWNDHLTDGVRVIGPVYVLLAFLDRRRRNGS